MSERLHTGRVLVVEGKYDAARLARLTDAMILLTGGFAVFSDKKRQRLLKQLAEQNGLILLTDSDKAGFQIRTLHHQPGGGGPCGPRPISRPCRGRSRRKAAPGKEGLLGVEGVPDEVVLRSLRQALGSGGRTSPPPPGRDGPSPTPTCTTGACRGRRGPPSGNTGCWGPWACRPASPKRKCWRYSTGCIPLNSWTACSPDWRRTEANARTSSQGEGVRAL